MNERRWAPEAVAGRGWILGTVDEGDGGEPWPWIFDPALIEAAEGVANQVGLVVVPEHEDVGPLPPAVQSRLDGNTETRSESR